MTDFVFRQLEEADFGSVWEIHARGNLDVANVEPLLAPTSSLSRTSFVGALSAEFREPDHSHVVAVMGLKVVGWGHAYATFTPDLAEIGYVDAVYVAEDSRRKGIGSSLIQSLVEWLEQRGVERIELTTPSRSDARALWVKRGFRPFMETLVFDPKK